MIPAAALLANICARGVEVRVDGSDLVLLAPDGVLSESDVIAIRATKTELVKLIGERSKHRLATRRAGIDGSAAELLDQFLADAAIPMAVFHSRRLRRDFVIARDVRALESLSEADRRLPVLTFGDCEKLGGLGAADLAAILDVREAFGPSAELSAVRARIG